MSETTTAIEPYQPDFWVLFSPEGKAVASMYPREDFLTTDQVDAAWVAAVDDPADIEPRRAEGWILIPVAQADWMDYWKGVRKPPEFQN